MELYFCHICGARVPEADVLSGGATVEITENRIICKDCTQASVHDAPTGTDYRPIEDIPELLPVKPNRRSSRSMLAAAPNNPAPTKPGPPPSKAPIIGLLIGGIMLCVALLIFLLRPAGKKNTGASDTPVASAAPTSTSVDSGVVPGKSTTTETATGSAVVVKQDAAPSPFRWVPISVTMSGDEVRHPYEPADRRWLALTWPFLPDNRPLAPPYSSESKPNAAPGLPGSMLASLGAESFEGGKAVKNYASKNKDARVVYPRANELTMSARFDLKLPLQGPATIAIEAYRVDKTPCNIAIGINGHEIFRGAEPSAAVGAWSMQTFAVQAEIIQAGRNEIRITNVMPTSAAGTPAYAIAHMDILSDSHTAAMPAEPPRTPPKPEPAATEPKPAPSPAAPVFPPIFTPEDKAALEFLTSVFVPLSKFDVDSALKLASTDTSTHGKQLSGALASAREVLERSIAAINKSNGALAVKITSGNLDISGEIIRIEGARVWIKSKGLETPADLSALPHDVFIKALGLNELAQKEKLDKIALLIALGDVDAAGALVHNVERAGASSDVIHMMNHYLQLERAEKFDAALNELTIAASSDKAASVPAQIQKLKRQYATLAEKHKQRLDYILSLAQSKKK